MSITSIAQILQAAALSAGMDGAAPPADASPITADTIIANIEQQIAENPELGNALAWRLTVMANRLERESDAAYDSGGVQQLLPEINGLAAGVDENGQFTVADNNFSAIYRLQNTLGIQTDNVFGPGTATALLEYLAETEQYQSLDGLDDLNRILEAKSLEAYAHYTVLADHANEMAELEASHAAAMNGANQFIADTFHQCVGRDVIDLTQENPFADIIDGIVDIYTTDGAEIALASEAISYQIRIRCGDALAHLPDDMQRQAIEAIAQQIGEPLRNAVTARIEEIRVAHDQNLIEQGRIAGVMETKGVLVANGVLYTTEPEARQLMPTPHEPF